MTTSPQGRAFIRQWEGVEAKAYQDAIGLWTIGVGHLLTRSELTSGKILIAGDWIKWREGLSEQQIDWLLMDDLASAEACVSNIRLALHQRQFDALVSFVFNIGEGAFRRSTLAAELNALAGRMNEIAETQMMRWVRAGGQRIDGLVNRRRAEVAYFTGLVDEMRST